MQNETIKTPFSDAYAILRAKRHDTFESLARMEEHGMRSSGNIDHCDPERTPKNEFGGAPGGCDPRRLVECVRKKYEQLNCRKRKNGCLAVEVLLSASFEAFGRDPNAPNEEFLQEWRDRSITWLQARFPDLVAAHHLHMDESTPHIHAFIVPAAERKGPGGVPIFEASYKSHFNDGRDSGRTYKDLQDDYALAMKPLGLKRGRPKKQTKARHKPVWQWRNEVADLTARLDTKEREINELKREYDTAFKELTDRERKVVRFRRELEQREQNLKEQETQLKSEIARERFLRTFFFWLVRGWVIDVIRAENSTKFIAGCEHGRKLLRENHAMIRKMPIRLAKLVEEVKKQKEAARQEQPTQERHTLLKRFGFG